MLTYAFGINQWLIPSACTPDASIYRIDHGDKRMRFQITKSVRGHDTTSIDVKEPIQSVSVKLVHFNHSGHFRSLVLLCFELNRLSFLVINLQWKSDMI